MLSLNGIRPFGGKPNTKTVRAWPKADNIISFRAKCYIKWYEAFWGRLNTKTVRVWPKANNIRSFRWDVTPSR